MSSTQARPATGHDRHDAAARRENMVARHIEARGVRDNRLLDAFGRVPRERFVPEEHRSLAYEDTPLPIGAGQTISQPYIVAYMIEALTLEPGDKVLEIGAGSGYAAAVLAELVDKVYAVERIGELAKAAANRLAECGYGNVRVLHADGSEGWPERAPFDAILVSAGAEQVPQPLLDQLAVGGRMVIPVGEHRNVQELVRITRRSENEFDYEDLADVRFVPLVSEQEQADDEPAEPATARVITRGHSNDGDLPDRLARSGEEFESHERANIDYVLDHIGDARVVLIGEATHGTSEFYRLRAAITERLIEEKGFRIVAAEADWPDAARIDHYVRHRDASPADWTAFARFPTWMWRNTVVRDFVDWLHEYNKPLDMDERAGFYGLDLYSLYNSIQEVVGYLEDVDPDLAEVARWRYGCLSPWEADPAAYGHAALSDDYRGCEKDVTRMLVELFERRQEYVEKDGTRFLDAAQNATLVRNAERYYRTMYYGSRTSWNLRDSHMFDTLKRVLGAHGEHSRAVVWAHNSHIGDARATEMSARGEYNIGQLCREEFGDAAFLLGFGTDHGTVAAASDWDGAMEVMDVRPAHARSYEHLFHASGRAGLLLPISGNEDPQVPAALARNRLERAIGVIYRPESELASHYFEADLSRQFDFYAWIDATTAVTPLDTSEMRGMPETYPFGV